MPLIRAPRKPPSKPQDIDFGHTSNQGKSGFESAMRLVNGFAENLGKGKVPVPVYATPGTTRFDQSTPFVSGTCRGMLYVENYGLIVVCGTSVAVFNKTGFGTLISGSVAGTNMVYMAANAASPPQIGIVADQYYYVLNTATNTIALQTLPGLPPPNSICGLDGYLVFSISDGRIFHTNINDALTVNPLAFGTISTAPYALRRVAAYRNKLVSFGERSVEAWDDLGTLPFAFAQNSTSWDIGCMSGQSIAVINENLLWVDHNGRVVQFKGFSPNVVSIPAVERAIKALTSFQKTLLYATVTHTAGHDFYALTSLYWTWELDLSTGLWHERQSNNQNNWFARCWENMGGEQHVIGSASDFTLHLVDETSNTENNGQPFTLLSQSETISGFSKGLIFDEVQVDTIVGSGVTNSGATHQQQDAQDPQLQLSWSDDGGNTWQGGRSAPLGKTGKRLASVSFYQLGACRRGGRVLQLSCQSTVARGIFLVKARMRSYDV